MKRVTRRSLLGMNVEDCDGRELGCVVDTWPDAGGWELELVVVRLNRFGERRMLPADAVVAIDGVLRTPYSLAQLEDSPPVERGGSSADVPDRAKWYWQSEEPPRPGSLTPRCLPSSGSSVTARPSPTSPSPTTSGS